MSENQTRSLWVRYQIGGSMGEIHQSSFLEINALNITQFCSIENRIQSNSFQPDCSEYECNFQQWFCSIYLKFGSPSEINARKNNVPLNDGIFLSFSSTECTSPPVVTNAQVTMTGMSEGSTATYTCNDGYEPSGSMQKACRSGAWTASGPEPTCTGTFYI